MTVAILIFSGLLLYLFIMGRKMGDWKITTMLLVGWSIKCFAALSFYYVYSEVYGKGELTEDAGAYIEEARILNTIYEDNPEDYFNVIFNKHDYEKTIIRYFKNVKISRIGPQAFLINDTRNQIKLISLVSLIIGDNIFALFTFFALLSFLGLLVLWRSLVKRSSLNSMKVFILLLLPLSLLFWTSGPLKETTSLFGLELFFAAVFAENRMRNSIFIGAIGLLFMCLFKPYIALILGASFVLVYLYFKIAIEKKWTYGLSFIVLGILLFSFSIPKKVLFTLSDKQFDFVNVARGGVHMEGDTCFYFLEKINRHKISVKDSVVHILEPVEVIAIEKGKIRREQKFTLHQSSENLRYEYEQFGGSSFFQTRAIDRDWGNLLFAIPESIVNALFRPFFWTDFFSARNVLLFLENLFFLILLFQIVIKSRSFSEMKIKRMIATLLLATFLFSIVIGLTTTASGAIVRYRIPIHLFILVSYISISFKHEQQSE